MEEFEVVASGPGWQFVRSVADKTFHLRMEGSQLDFDASPMYVRFEIPEDILDEVAEAWTELRLDETDLLETYTDA